MENLKENAGQPTKYVNLGDLQKENARALRDAETIRDLIESGINLYNDNSLLSKKLTEALDKLAAIANAPALIREPSES
jgi:hypothetical protein